VITLEEAKADLRKHLDEGARCPCCTQFAKVYRRKIHAAMARDLVITYREAGDEWFHVRKVLGYHHGDFAKLAMWELIEESSEKRDDGGRAGWWRVTPLGTRYVSGVHRVPKYARVYDGRLLSLDHSELVDIHDALGTKFSLADLMAGR
jgi:hypothetical protein